MKINLQSSVYSAGGELISDQVFGGNFLFDRDKVDQVGTLAAKAAALNIGFLRYPGGTISEQFFRLTDPNRSTETGGYSGDIVPLNQFSAFVTANQLEYSLVMPTLQYMQGLHDQTLTIADIRAEVRTFLNGLKSGAFGAEAPKIFEIGNEYYTIENMSYTLEADLYGKVAKALALEIRGVLGSGPEISIQAGFNEEANNVILNHFAGRDSLVNSVVAHSYPWTLAEVRDQIASKMALADKWISTGIAEEVFLSEWNISDQIWKSDGTKIEKGLQERGMANAVAIVEMLGGYIDAGVDLAAVWPLQQRTATDLAGNEGETSEDHDGLSHRNLSLVGEAFRLMSESVPGTRALRSRDIDLDGIAESARYRDEILVQAFESANKATVFVSAWDLNASQLGTSYRIDLPGAFTNAEVTRLHVGTANVTDPNAQPIIERQSDIAITRTSDIELSLDRAYEIYRIEFTKADHFAFNAPSQTSSLTPNMDGILFSAFSKTDPLGYVRRGSPMTGDEGHDAFSGGATHDRMKGYAGRDVIKGGSGHDVINGGIGDDILHGNNHRDKVMGKSGDDRILGHKGADTLAGGGGDDLVKGGMGSDLLRGGRGDDRVKSGHGDDLIKGGKGDDVINGGKGNDLLFGGDGDDKMISVHGNDQLTGGQGADLFVFKPSNSTQFKIIKDFQVGIDHIQFRGTSFIEDDAIRGSADGAVISVGNLTVMLLDIQASSLSNDIFAF